MELEEEVANFVDTIKQWPLKALRQEGRVLTDLYARPGGDYYCLNSCTVVRFGLKNEDQLLPSHSIG